MTGSQLLYVQFRCDGMNAQEARLAVYRRLHRDKYFPAFKMIEDVQ